MNSMSINQIENRRIVYDILVSGVLTGVIAGFVMTAILCAHFAVVGLGFWLPVQLFSGMFYGADAILGGTGPTIVGLAMALVASSVAGFIFSLILRPRTPTSDALAFGLIFGIVMWALRTYLVLPAFNQTLSDRVTLIPGWWFFSHLAFGACMGLLPRIRTQFAKRLHIPDRVTRVAA